MDLQQLLLALLAHIGVLRGKKSQTVWGGPVVAVVVLVILVLVIVVEVVGWGDPTVVVLLVVGGPTA